MYGYIYATINKSNGMFYIGKRKGKFNSNYYGSGIYLCLAIHKYGKAMFYIEVIDYAECKEKLNELEKSYIQNYRELLGNHTLYNIANGGDGGATWFGPHTQETKDTIKQKKLLYKFTDEHLKNIKEGAKNRPPVTEITKEKHKATMLTIENPAKSDSARRINRELSMGNTNVLGRIWITNSIQDKMIYPTQLQLYLDNDWVLGRKPFSEETKSNMRQPRSEQHRQNMTKGRLGKKRGPYKKTSISSEIQAEDKYQ